MDGAPVPDALRELVREVLRDVLPALAGQNSSRSFASSTPTQAMHVSAPSGPRASSSGPPAGERRPPAVPPTPPTSDPPPSPPAGVEGAPGIAGVNRAPGITGVNGAGIAGVNRAPGIAGVNGAPGIAGVNGAPGTARVSAEPGASGGRGSGAYPTASEPGGTPQPVRLATDEDLREFVLQIVRLADNPKRRRDLVVGRLRFTLAAAGFSAAPAGLVLHPGHGSANGHGPLSAAGTGQADHRIERGAVTERAVQAAASAGARLVLGPRAVLTPLARDRARALGVPIEKER